MEGGPKMGRARSMVMPGKHGSQHEMAPARKHASGAGMSPSQSMRVPSKSNQMLPPIQKGFARKGAAEENPLAARYEQMRRSKVMGHADGSMSSTSLHRRSRTTGSTLPPGYEDAEDGPETAETENWMHSVMATMSQKPRKSLLIPLALPGEVYESGADANNQSAAAIDNKEQKSGASTPKETPEDGAKAEDKAPKVVEVNDGKTPNCLPEAEAVLRRLNGDQAQGFESNELARMRATFNRFKVPDTIDVHKDDLAEILSRLGYMMCDEEEIKKIADDISIYSTLDFNEFVSVVERFSNYEIGKFKETFEKFDEDSSGQLSAVECEKLMSELGFTPLKSMIKEALDVVDKDGSGQLNFPEFIHLQAIYRSSEGFNASEVDRLMELFRDECEGGKDAMSATKLKELLLHFYGPQSLEHVKVFAKEASAPSSRKDAVVEEGETVKVPELHFPEVMIWARRLREAEFADYAREFEKQDTDGSGFVDLEEIQMLMQSFHLTCNKAAIQEFINLVDDDWVPPDEQTEGDPKEKDGKLDYDEFVNLMILLRDSDGFTKAELKGFKLCFKRFDDDDSGDVDVLELSDMLRYLGHNSKLDDVHQLIAKVDFNDSGSLDFREFVRLMRIHRETEIVKIKKAFNSGKDANSGCVPSEKVPGALKECETSLPDKNESSSYKMPMAGVDLDFDSFVSLVDNVREFRVAEGRKKAGFSNQEIDKFRKMFDHYDADHSGLIDAKEVANCLTDLGFKLGTKEERDNVLKQLDQARKSALDCGVVEGAQDTGGQVSFWVLIQLLRVLYNRDDKRILDREAHAAEQSRFSQHEIEEFREVFLGWHTHEAAFEEEAAANQVGGERKTEGEQEANASKEITKDGMRRLLRSLGCNLTAQNRLELEGKIAELHGPGPCMVDFASFLRLMRWMLDTNFADINKAADGSGK